VPQLISVGIDFQAAKMCSFTEETLVCADCGQLIHTSSILFKTCDPKPTMHCKTYKKRGTVHRYAPADECSSCSRRMLDEEADVDATMDKVVEAQELEEMCAMIDAIVEAKTCATVQEGGEEDSAVERPSNSQPSAGCGWGDARLEDYIRPARSRRSHRARVTH
jgi:hypothetical protein